MKARLTVHHCSFSCWVYSAKLRWSFCCQNLCSNSFQASQGWKNWALQFKKKKEKETALNYFIQGTLHPPSNFYMGSLCFPVCLSPWFQVIARVSFHFFLCFPFLFLLFLCKEEPLFIFFCVWACSAVGGRRVLVSCHLPVNRAHIWTAALCIL